MQNTMKKSKFVKDSNGQLINLVKIYGMNYFETGLMSFDKNGYSYGWIERGHASYELINAFLIKQLVGKFFFSLPNGGRAHIDILDDVFINPNSGNLIIKSIAPNTSLFIATEASYSDIEGLLTEVQDSMISISDGGDKQVDWAAYSVSDT
jgi:hypothetical protein